MSALSRILFVALALVALAAFAPEAKAQHRGGRVVVGGGRVVVGGGFRHGGVSRVIVGGGYGYRAPVVFGGYSSYVAPVVVEQQYVAPVVVAPVVQKVEVPVAPVAPVIQKVEVPAYTPTYVAPVVGTVYSYSQPVIVQKFGVGYGYGYGRSAIVTGRSRVIIRR